MKRASARRLLALGAITAAAAVVLGVAHGSGTHSAVPTAGVPDAPIGVTSAAAHSSSPSKMVGYAEPVRIPPLRTLASRPYRFGKQAEPESESQGTRHVGNATDPVVQRSAPKNRMPGPIQN